MKFNLKNYPNFKSSTYEKDDDEKRKNGSYFYILWWHVQDSNPYIR